MNDVSPLRVGAVSYLNTKPLIYDFASLVPDATLSLDYPSRLADQLAVGSLDVALIPSIEFFQDPTYAIVSNACIGCRGPVLSVKLFSRVPIDRIRTLALDEGSRTSAALVRILLHERCGVVPQCEPLPLGNSLDDTRADAVLLIGDRAMHSPPGKFVDVWDLGDEWVRWTGLPFVFAMWTARAGCDLRGLDAGLERARDAGLAHLDEIAAREAPPLGLTKPECLAYLRDNLHFVLADSELRGLERFHKLAQKLNLAPAGVELGCFSVENSR